MKYKLLFLLFSISAFSQEKNTKYIQFELSTPLQTNSYRDGINQYNQKKDPSFLPDGLSSKIGYGFQHNKWISLGLHTGIDWKVYEKLVAVPFFANLKLSPKIGEETRIALQLGYGQAFALGRGNLSGVYKKISLGFQNADNLILFAELSNYNFTLHNEKGIAVFSLGIALISF